MPFSNAIHTLRSHQQHCEHAAANPAEPVMVRESLLEHATSLQSAISHLQTPASEVGQHIDLVRQWGLSRGITGPDGKATVHTQFEKTREEFIELEDAIALNDLNQMIDGIGDVTVTLILISELIGVPFEVCLETAYSVISKRTGSMQDGFFIKDA